MYNRRGEQLANYRTSIGISAPWVICQLLLLSFGSKILLLFQLHYTFSTLGKTKKFVLHSLNEKVH